MDTIKMSYGGYTFEANPETVKTAHAKTTSVSHIPYGKGKSRVLDEAPAVITGKGRFCKGDARVQAQQLLSVFRRGGVSYLFTPVFSPIRAFFTGLDFSVSAGGECVEYRFEFTEAPGKKRPYFDFGFTVAACDENLFDIANRTNVPIEQLIDRNGYEHPFAVREGDRVWLK